MPEEPRVGEVLPGANEAVIPREKLVGYVLNPSHPRGGDKSIAFKAALGIERPQWAYLRDQIRAGLPQCPVFSTRPAEGARPATWRVLVPVAGLNVRRKGGQRGLTI